MILVAKVLLTIAAIQYGFIPLIVDFSESHVFHPNWPPHARFHLVWLLASGAIFAAYVIFSIWLNSSKNPERLKHLSIIGCIVLGAFFLSVSVYPLYGGSLSDAAEPNTVFGVHGNVFGFAIASVLQLTGTFLIWRNNEQST